MLSEVMKATPASNAQERRSSWASCGLKQMLADEPTRVVPVHQQVARIADERDIDRDDESRCGPFPEKTTEHY